MTSISSAPASTLYRLHRILLIIALPICCYLKLSQVNRNLFHEDLVLKVQERRNILFLCIHKACLAYWLRAMYTHRVQQRCDDDFKTGHTTRPVTTGSMLCIAPPNKAPSSPKLKYETL